MVVPHSSSSSSSSGEGGGDASSSTTPRAVQFAVRSSSPEAGRRARAASATSGRTRPKLTTPVPRTKSRPTPTRPSTTSTAEKSTSKPPVASARTVAPATSSRMRAAEQSAAIAGSARVSRTRPIHATRTTIATTYTGAALRRPNTPYARRAARARAPSISSNDASVGGDVSTTATKRRLLVEVRGRTEFFFVAWSSSPVSTAILGWWSVDVALGGGRRRRRDVSWGFGVVAAACAVPTKNRRTRSF
mmetsp:Transcript_16204/g.65477  ORF Transcript_16204/g.65477 Transcript_16204/m.65477 type:complete len:247 (+) Transcript_16204:1549-2289(+)